MRAIVIHQAKDLRIDTFKPTAPGAGEVLIRLECGGVCGSDLHYYNHGGFGAVRLKEPMILGHEVAGRIIELGADTGQLRVGQLVAVSPSRPDGTCKFCRAGLPNQCLNMRFYGSAMPFPHIQGAFQELLVADAAQCVPADGITAGEAAMAEPLSVALHAVRRAGNLVGRKVLITGCGPIGTLCILAARRAGAAEIVATDLAANALDHAARAGADNVINIAEDPDALSAFAEDKGYFDVLFECSGAAVALANAIAVMAPRGTILQLGLGGDMNVPIMPLIAKELELRGSFRFHEEFPIAVAMMQKGLIDVKALITHTIALDQAEDAFKIANDRSQAMKAQIKFV